MKTTLLLFLSLFTITNLFSQTNTVTIDWSFGSNPTAAGDANSNRTIEVGDTVTWNWYANGTHNVSSLNSATESFQSALMGNGGTFSHTFTQVGTNDYQCDPHPTSMFGRITVVAEGTLSTERFDIFKDIKMYPNPVESTLFFDFSNQTADTITLEIINMLGKQVRLKTLDSNSSIDISNLVKGIYFVRLSSKENNLSVTKKIVKL